MKTTINKIKIDFAFTIRKDKMFPLGFDSLLKSAGLYITSAEGIFFGDKQNNLNFQVIFLN